MVVKFKEYQQLNGEIKSQIATVGSNILRRFDRTEFPVEQTDVVCPHFMELAWANGCMYNCAWCYLKGTFRFSPQKENGRVKMVFKARPRVQKDILDFLKVACSFQITMPEVINTGELSDSLMDETNDSPFSSWILGFFIGTPHKVLFLTKSTNIKSFIEHEYQKNAIVAWSVNAEAVADSWEKYAPSPLERLKAAGELLERGYEVRLRIDPMVPIEDWQLHYGNLVNAIANIVGKPNRITLGSLRGLGSTIARCKDKSWVKYLSEKSNWGKRSAFASRLAMYQFVIGKLAENGITDVGFCKETLEMWKALGRDYREIKCNCTM